jgi:hypothetical protein
LSFLRSPIGEREERRSPRARIGALVVGRLGAGIGGNGVVMASSATISTTRASTDGPPPRAVATSRMEPKAALLEACSCV